MTKSVNIAPAIPLPAIPLPPVVLGETLCRQCGYDLRTLSSDANCPECNAPVRLSLENDLLLRSADPAWLKKILAGILILLIAEVLLTATSRYGLYRYLIFQVSLANYRILRIAAITASLFGSWLLSTPEPTELRVEKSNPLRNVFRILILIDFVYVACQSVYNLLPFQWHTPVVWSLFIAAAAEKCLLYLYLKTIIERIPAASLSRAAIFFSISLPVLTLWPFLLLLRIIQLLVITQRNLTFAQMIIDIASLIFLNTVRLQVSQQLDIARRTWPSLHDSGNP
jgi:hypothetical protein